MAEPRTGPCAPWIDADEVFDCRPCSKIAAAAQDADLAAMVVDVASEILFMLSRRQFSGACTETVRPCRRSTRWNTFPVWGPSWNATWGVCSCQAETWRECGCGSLDEITLGGSPLITISEVKIDGVVLDPSKYRIDDHRFLVRTDGEGWPCCQDLAADDTEVDTWSVTYIYGVAPPVAGELAAKRLACEFYQACTGGPCNLPQRVQTITRQDVTLALLDPFAFLERGKTGLYEVDLFLSAYVTAREARTASIASPDIGPRIRRADTGTAPGP